MLQCQPTTILCTRVHVFHILNLFRLLKTCYGHNESLSFIAKTTYWPIRIVEKHRFVYLLCWTCGNVRWKRKPIIATFCWRCITFINRKSCLWAKTIRQTYSQSSWRRVSLKRPQANDWWISMKYIFSIWRIFKNMRCMIRNDPPNCLK
jgi:hypothetical protein